MFDKIAFIHYPTQNLQRALEFYRDVLGFRILVQNEEWIEFEVGDQRLALRQFDTPPPDAQNGNPRGAQVWLEARPIEPAINRLIKNKVNFINKLEVFSYGKTAIFQDPDGNPIGLYEPPQKNT